MAVQVQRCRTETCKARILFVTLIKADGTKAAKPHPVNAEPDPKGNLEYVRGTEEAPVLRALSAKQQAQPAEHDRYSSHFASCPGAEAWRHKSTDRPGARRRRAGRSGASR